MEAFYVCIIFLGVLLVIASLFFIAMDRVNGKDFFKEFDRKKDEMFNLIQDSEEMVQELNRMSDYVVTIISEKNQEFFNKSTNINIQEPLIKIEEASGHESKELVDQVQEELILPTSGENTKQDQIFKAAAPQNKEPDVQRLANTPFSYNKDINKDSSDIGKSKLTLNSARREVLQLIEQGLSNDEISDKLKMGKGEIGLIRGLSR
ncbi:MAG: DUF6115 domain-containing protein [Ruminiclostridium sp.]